MLHEFLFLCFFHFLCSMKLFPCVHVLEQKLEIFLFVDFLVHQRLLELEVAAAPQLLRVDVDSRLLDEVVQGAQAAGSTGWPSGAVLRFVVLECFIVILVQILYQEICVFID